MEASGESSFDSVQSFDFIRHLANVFRLETRESPKLHDRVLMSQKNNNHLFSVTAARGRSTLFAQKSFFADIRTRPFISMGFATARSTHKIARMLQKM